MLAKTMTPKRSDTITEKILDDEIILYNKKTHTIHSLNQTAGILWNLCDGTVCVMQMINVLLENCKGSKTVIENDVLNTLQEMEVKELITVKTS